MSIDEKSGKQSNQSKPTRLMIEEWVNWVARLWHGPFKHGYVLTRSRHWKGYREAFKEEKWTCKSLAEAREKYYWNHVLFFSFKILWTHSNKD